MERLKVKPNAVLIVDNHIPEFNRDSGSRRLFELIKLMLSNDMSVFLLADLKEYKYKSDYIETYRNQGVYVYEPFLDEHNTLITKARFIQKIAPSLRYAWLHRPTIFDKYYTAVKSANAKCKCIYDMVDFHYLRLIREYELNKKSNLKKDAEAFLSLEINNCKKADTVIAISENDKASLKAYFKEDNKIEVIGNVHQYIEKEDGFKPFDTRKQLLFLGGFKHLPNVDAVIYLKQEIMPLVWKNDPNIDVVIVGSYPPQEVLDLHSDKFIVKGFVEDVSEYFKHSKLFVAPLRYGAGVKGKIGQSFEWSLPVITTDVGIEGFDVSPFHDDMIGNTPEDFASKILKIYNDETLWNDISDHSKVILKPFSLQGIDTVLKSVLQ